MAEIHRIETSRLIIEPASVVDKSGELANAIHEADEFEWYYGIEETEERLKQININFKGFYNIFDLENIFIGYVGFSREDEDYEIEIYILKEFRGLGYGKECLMTMLKEAFEGNIEDTVKEDFSRIISSVKVENVPSRSLMESCGFLENKEKGDLCILFRIPDDDEDVALGKPIYLAHYYITRERFLSLQNHNYE
ncbi:MAG: GNAT family N-acetyltransferase [Lachnospiraceae bacterium]|nr:GNAT family N-acetyltransferase [Lachnospiraceae bacterium]